MNILCPVCREKLIRNEKSYVCKNGHVFDIAKEGYLNLNLRNSQNTGDNPDMIKARRNFLEKGYYSFLRDKIDGFIEEDDSLVDLACGEGYYTSYFKAMDKTGIDLSKAGLKIASKHDKSSTYLLSSIFRVPLEDRCADKVLTIFAPIAGEEIRRILKDDGTFILVRPDEDHLFELKQVIYDHPYLNETEETKIEGLRLTERIKIKQKTKTEKNDITDLFMMTPYYNTSSRSDKEKLDRIGDLEITFSFLIDLYRKD